MPTLSTTFKLAALCVLLALLGVACTYSAWQFRAAMARNEVASAVADTIARKDEELQAERDTTKMWRDSANELRARTEEKKTEARVVTTTVKHVLKVEREANPSFYEQEVPTKGAEQWEAARNLMR